MKSIRWSLVIIPMLIAVVTALCYWPSLFYPFQFDDNLAILKQFSIRLPNFFDHFFAHTRWVGNWINALNFAWSKFDPVLFRATNVLIHVVATCGVFALCYFLLGFTDKKSFTAQYNILISTLVAVLFALHPVQTQTVSYVIQGRLEGLATLCIILALLSFVHMTQTTRTLYRIITGFVALKFLFFAYGTKEIAIVAPLLFLLVDWFFIARGDWRNIKKRWLWYGALGLLTSAVYLYFKRDFIFRVITFNTQTYNNVGNVLTDSVTDSIGVVPFMLSQFKVILHYIGIFFWPFNMSVEYDWKLVQGFFAPDCLLPFLALAALGFLVGFILKQRKTSIVGFSFLWFMIAILPRSSIIPSPELLVDYKTYLASFGIFMLCAIGIAKLLVFVASQSTSKQNYRTSIYVVGVMTVALVLGGFTMRRNKVWESDLVFWHDIVLNAPRKARAYNNYAIALIQANRCQEAIYHLKEALRLQNGHYWDPYTNLSIAYSHLGKLDLAIDAIKRAIKINRYHPESFNSLGLLFQQKNRLDDAQRSFEVAIALRRHYGKARFNLGQLFVQKNESENAWDCFKKCCLEDDFDTVPDGFLRYATLSMHLNKIDDAITGYSKLVELDAQYPDAVLNLGNAYYVAKKYDQALTYYRKAAELQPQDFRPLANVAQVLIKLDKPGEALSVLKQARTLPGAPLELELKIAHCFELVGEREMADHLLQKLAKQRDDEMVNQRARELLQSRGMRVGRLLL